MRRAAAMFILSAGLLGCENPPEWWKKSLNKPSPPISVPTSAEPASRPAVAPAPRPATRPATRPAARPTTPLPVPPKPVTASPKPAPKPAPRPGAEVMAYVNDRPIYMAELTELLITGHGIALAQQLVANELVSQQAAKQGIAVTKEELDAEHTKTLRNMFGNVSDPNQQERLLDQLLARNHVSEPQWQLTMRRNALLAKLAVKQVVVGEEDLRAEFDRRYERKVEVQHIQTASLADAQKVLRELASGEDFTAMVAKYSTGPSAKNGGMLAPFGVKDTGTPPAIRDAGLALRKIGEVSDPIQIGTAFHVIKLIRTIEPKDVKYETVKAALLEPVRARKIKALQQDILQILIRGGRVQYVHPVLKEQAEKGTTP